MKTSHRLIFFLNAFSTGLVAAVLSLIYLAHGADIQTLSIFISIFAVSTILLELPSGILADLFGRKKMFLLAALCSAASNFLLIFAHTPWLLGISCIFRGAGTAFASGSLESLEVEQSVQSGGTLSAITSSIAVTEGMGLALGAVCGGILGNAEDAYVLLLGTAAGIGCAVFVLTAFFIQTTARRPQKASRKVKEQLRALVRGLKESKILRLIFSASILTGSVQAVTEVYWQQNFIACAPSNFRWSIGILCALGYAAVILGSKTEPRLADRMGDFPLYWLTKFALPPVVAALGLCQDWQLFVCIYVLIDIVLGIGDVSERTLLHAAMEDAYRASMLSVYSLALRIGVVISSVSAAVIVPKWGAIGIWLIVPLSALALLTALFLTAGRETLKTPFEQK